MKPLSFTIPVQFLLVGAFLASATPAGAAAAQEQSRDDPSTTLWYTRPAGDWQREALPIGSGRLGAMIFGGVGHERISLNEETVWSGSPVNWNRRDAAKNLPKIRQLLLAGKNAEAEAMVNQTFTCVGGGSRGGARGPWGCYQELGNLNIVWSSNVQTIPLNKWKYKMITTPGITDIRKHRREVSRLVAGAAEVDVDDRTWADYVIANGKAVKGGRKLNLNDKVLLRHHMKLTKQEVADLGVLRVGSAARNGRVFVNGQQVGTLPGWQSVGHAKFRAEVSQLLKPGDNVIAIYCSNYRRRGQMPVSVSLDPREDTQEYRRRLDLRDSISTVQCKMKGVRYRREAFASAPDQVMVFRFARTPPARFRFQQRWTA